VSRGAAPFAGGGGLFAHGSRVAKRPTPTLRDGSSKDAAALVAAALDRDEAERPSADALLSGWAFVAGYDWRRIGAFWAEALQARRPDGLDELEAIATAVGVRAIASRRRSDARAAAAAARAAASARSAAADTPARRARELRESGRIDAATLDALLAADARFKAEEGAWADFEAHVLREKTAKRRSGGGFLNVTYRAARALLKGVKTLRRRSDPWRRRRSSDRPPDAAAPADELAVTRSDPSSALYRAGSFRRAEEANARARAVNRNVGSAASLERSASTRRKSGAVLRHSSGRTVEGADSLRRLSRRLSAKGLEIAHSDPSDLRERLPPLRLSVDGPPAGDGDRMSAPPPTIGRRRSSASSRSSGSGDGERDGKPTAGRRRSSASSRSSGSGAGVDLGSGLERGAAHPRLSFWAALSSRTTAEGLEDARTMESRDSNASSMDSGLDLVTEDALNDLYALAEELGVDVNDIVDAMQRGEERAERAYDGQQPGP